MKKILILLMVCISVQVTAQQVYTSSGKPVNARKKQEQKKKGFDVSRIVLGGSVGFAWGDEATAISVAPVVGYRILDKLAVGIGGGYQYFRQKDFFQVTDLNGYTNFYDLKASITSASVWARYQVFERLIVHAEFEYNFMSFNDYGFDPSGSGNIVSFKTKYNAPSVLLGVGYRQPIGSNASIYIMGLYDVIQDKYSPYGKGIFPRIGFNIGF